MEYFWYTLQIPHLAEKLLQQLWLVSLALASAIIAGVPLGILAQRFLWLRTPLLTLANILQTIPSLALLAMLLPVFGIGAKPAIIVLTLYAILPIVRNTFTGLQQISPLLREVSAALGLTPWQRLRWVELPLAAPVIVAGIRTATAMTVGIATIAAFIGAGGLGDFINRGLAMNNTRLLLLGAIPAACLALLLDGLLAHLEKRVSYLTPGWSKPTYRYWLGWLAGLILLFGSIAIYHHQQSILQRTTIRIASKNFTEQNILGELMAQMISAHTRLKVVRDFNLGTTQICQTAMERGEIDLYPEYTGTAYMTVLHRTQPLSPQALLATVKTAYAKQFGIIWLAPFGFNNAQALAVRHDFAQRYALTTVSDLAPLAADLRLGAPPEYLDRADGLPLLQRVYHLQFGKVIAMEPGLMYRAIHYHKVDVINAFTTDGRITAYHLVLLQDDKHSVPAYQAAPLVRSTALKANPQLAIVLSQLAGQISDEDMQRMNYAVDIEKQSPASVALHFLQAKHLL